MNAQTPPQGVRRQPLMTPAVARVVEWHRQRALSRPTLGSAPVSPNGSPGLTPDEPRDAAR